MKLRFGALRETCLSMSAGFVCETNVTIWPKLKAQYCCYDWLIAQKKDIVAHKHYICRFLFWHTRQPTWKSSWSCPRSQGRGSDPQGSFLIKADRRLAFWDQKTCTGPESKCRPQPVLTELFLTLLALIFTVMLILSLHLHPSHFRCERRRRNDRKSSKQGFTWAVFFIIKRGVWHSCVISRPFLTLYFLISVRGTAQYNFRFVSCWKETS